METEIYTRAIGYFQVSDAVVLSLLQIVVVLAALALVRLCGAGGSGVGGPVGTQRRAVGDGDRLGARCGRRGMPVGGTVVGRPLAVLAVWSVRPQSGCPWTVEGYRSLARSVNGVTPLETLAYSAFSAAIAALVAVVIGTLGAYVIARGGRTVGGVGNFVATLPLGISAVTLGFGYLIVLAAPLPREIRTSPLIIPAVQSLIAIPVVIRIVVPALDAVGQRVRQAAITLGATPWRVWTTVELPGIARSLGAAAGFAFVMALGEFGATGWRYRTSTLPVLDRFGTEQAGRRPTGHRDGVFDVVGDRDDGGGTGDRDGRGEGEKSGGVSRPRNPNHQRNHNHWMREPAPKRTAPTE